MIRIIAIASTTCVMACASYPAPTQRMADAIATSRGAKEVGAESNPKAQLHLRLAEEQIQRAKKLMDEGENKRADFVLVRAKADADLALAEARDAVAEKSANEVKARVEAARKEGGLDSKGGEQ